MTAPSSTSGRWQRIEALFDAALALPEGQREGYLAQECAGEPELRADVETLLRADQHEGLLDSPLDAVARGLLAGGCDEVSAVSTLADGTKVGPYRIVRELGRGGMGAVYLAERADGAYEQHVALKVVRASPVAGLLERRFLRERQILARLQHPNIARLLDAGVTEAGAPFLVMEFVSGEPITTWAEARSLAVEERLRLFLGVCAAVQFAHRNLVIHRDLKPSNVLVDADGRVRLLDFGIARLMEDSTPDGAGTRTDHLLLTPEYAAPEQIRGEPASTATDIYALGALLYELMSGHKAVQLASRDLAEILRAVNEDPPRLGHRTDVAPSLQRRLRGDVEAITHKALAKDAERRYGSVESLAADVRRHLDHLPVEAQPEGVWYRTAKFARRHFLSVSAVAAIVLAVAAGLVGTAWQGYNRSLEARKAEEVKAFVLGLFSGADPMRARGEELTARELVEEGTTRIEREFVDEPAVRAEVMTFLADIHEKLGEPDKALTLVDQALTVLGTSGSVDAAASGAQLVKGRALLAKGELDAATNLFRTALAADRDAKRFSAVAESLDQLAIIGRQRGDLPGSRQLTQEAYEIRQRELGSEHPDVADSLNNLGVVSRESGDYEAALRYHEQALAMRRRVLPPDHPATGVSLNNLGALLFAQGRYAEAETYFRQVLELDTRVFGDAHPMTIGASNNLGSSLLLQAKYTEAEPVLLRVLDYWRKTAGAEHPNALVTLSNLASSYRGEGAYDKAEPLYARLIETWPKIVGPEHPNVAVAHYHLGTILLDRGALDEAEKHLRRSREIRRATRGDKHPEYADSLRELAIVALYRGRTTEAASLAAQALTLQRKALEAPHPALAATLLVQGRILRAEASVSAARAAEMEGLGMLRARLPADHPDIARALLELGRTQCAARQWPEAEQSLLEARGIFAQRFGEGSWRVADTDSWIAAATWTRDPSQSRRRLASATRVLNRDLPSSHAAVQDNRRLVAGQTTLN